MSDPLLSVIVPVYKVEAFINKCLDSLLIAPSLMNKLEVILVNDGTPDNSAEMSRAYVNRYPDTFRQIDKENGGHGSAWNVGLSEAKGKYLRFLDSDDWFTNLDRLMEDLEKCDADVIFNPFIKVYAYDSRTEVMRTPIECEKPAPIAPSHWGTPEQGLNSVNFWAATYRTKILKPLLPLFAEGVMYDDFILSWAPLVYGRSYAAFNYVVYNYLLGRPGQSMSATKQRKGAVSYAKCFEHFEAVRSRIDSRSIPSDLLTCIDHAISEYAGFIFPFMVYLPLKESVERMKYLWDNYVSDKPKTKLYKRYERLPGMVFYYVEHLRRKIRKI
ncbi:MAG: glycosyltransferase [Bacteroidales bacterium]|nr:glycosyltransferase [Bacteroidales bacterium]